MFKAKFVLPALAILLVMASIISPNSSIQADSVSTGIANGPSTLQSSPPEAGLLNLVFGPDTDDSYVNKVYEDLNGQNALGFISLSNTSRWDPTRTATNDGAPAAQGEPLTLTYSFIPDGTNMPARFGGDTTCNSVLIATLDDLYGAANWRNEIDEVFATEWGGKTGNQYVFEANDDGSAWPDSPGILGVRGDIRIGGCAIDGNSGILAYNFFPSWGEMKIDVTDNFFEPGNLDTGFHNVFSHEHGHGAGMSHVCPINRTKLMEPVVNNAFIGMQHDDIRAAQRLYGDFNEFNGGRGNDTAAHPTDFGATADNAPILVSEVSIDDNDDEDWYGFTVGASKNLDVTVNPVGLTYLVGPPNSDGSCSPGTPTNSLAIHDLGFEVIDSDGTTVLTAVDTSGAGLPEAQSGILLGAAGPKFMRVFGDDTDDIQLYDLSFALSPVGDPELVFTVQPTDTSAGTIIIPPVEVAAQDGSGNTLIDFTGEITVAIDANPSAGVLSGTTVATAVSGIATFTDLSIDSGGAGYNLMASAPGLVGVSSAFAINPTTTTVATGDGSNAVAVNPRTNNVYVANANGDNVTVIQGSDNSTTTVAAGDGPNAVAVNPLTNKGYVANAKSDNVTVIDGSDNSTTTVAAGDGPTAVAVNPTINKVYVANAKSDTVTVIDGNDNSTTTVAAGDGPTAVAVNLVTHKVYVANNSSANVTVIDGSDNNTTTVDVGNDPKALAVNPVTNQVYVANRGGDVTVIDGSDGSTTTVRVGNDPKALAVNPVTNQVYVANRGGDVTVIDGNDHSTTNLAAGDSPNAVAVNPVTNKVYVGNQGSDNVTVINGSDNSITTVAAGTGPVAVAVNPETNHVYVANAFSDNVTVIHDSALADLSLSQTVNNSSPSEGDTVVYTLTVSNGGPDGATGVQVTDILPPGLSFLSAAASPGNYDTGTGVWSVGVLASSASATLDLTATIDSASSDSGSSGSTITNSAEVTASDQADPDSTPNNSVPDEDDQGSVNINIQAAGSLISNVVTSNGQTYQLDSLDVGQKLYVDRRYTFTTVPGEYIGHELITTANDDKNATNQDLLNFNLTADATVYVLFDDRVVTLPAWLDDPAWILTSDIFSTTDGSRRIYQKDYVAGAVKLGGNAMAPMGGAGSNYNVVAIAGGPGGPEAPATTITSSPSSVTNRPDATFTFTTSKSGSTFDCNLDGSGFSPCTSPQSYSALAEGSHTFQVRATDSPGTPNPTSASHAWTVDTTAEDNDPGNSLLSDSFGRPDNSLIGEGWVEIEEAGASVAIAASRLFFADTSDAANRPLVKRSFALATSGTLQWDFDFDWARTGDESVYRLQMQLGDSAVMTDDSQNDGVGVNLVWTQIGGVHQSLGYSNGGVDTALAVLSGPAHISVVADLHAESYSVSVNGAVVGTDIPFNASSPLNTVRYFTDGLNEQKLSGRTFDNVIVSSTEFRTPPPIPADVGQ